LFAKIGEAISQNYRVLAGVDCLIDNNAMAAVPNARVDSRYLFRFLQTVDMYSMTSSTAVPSLRKADLALIKVPLPPLPEQRRIASILDELDAIRRKRRHAIAVSVEAEDAALHKLLSDGPDARRVAVREIAEIQTGPFGSLLHKSDYIEGGIPLVNPTHIRDGRVVPDPEFSVTEATYSALKNYSLHPGDVVLGRRGEMGRAASITSAHGRLLCGTGSLIVRPRDGAVLGTVLAGMLASPLARRKLEQTAQGVTMLNLNQSIVGSLELNVPSMQSQVDFDEFRDALVASREYHQRHLAKLDELFVSVQHRAFRADSVSR
tara:strand:- start:6517 stop:7476 length:960 start_codon:yes stop_codon:yes gene_type:complete